MADRSATATPSLDVPDAEREQHQQEEQVLGIGQEGLIVRIARIKMQTRRV